MSTPVRGADGPLGYAPRWARTASGRADMALESRGRSGTPVQDPENPGTFYPRLDVNAAIGLAYYTADDALSKAFNNTRNSRAVPLTWMSALRLPVMMLLAIGWAFLE